MSVNCVNWSHHLSVNNWVNTIYTNILVKISLPWLIILDRKDRQYKCVCSIGVWSKQTILVVLGGLGWPTYKATIPTFYCLHHTPKQSTLRVISWLDLISFLNSLTLTIEASVEFHENMLSIKTHFSTGRLVVILSNVNIFQIVKKKMVAYFTLLSVLYTYIYIILNVVEPDPLFTRKYIHT